MAPTNQHRRPRVFISYSRRDAQEHGDFAQRLRDDLSASFEGYLDIKDIAPGEDWRARLASLIVRADAVIVCISPRSVASEICEWEINEAERLGKRLLPVVCVDTNPTTIPPRLNRLNFVFLRPSDERAAGLDQLVKGVETDIVWLRTGTWLGERAYDWQASSKSSSKLLRGMDLVSAEVWRDSRTKNAAQVSQLHLDYIRESRNFATRSTRRAAAAAVVIAVVSIGLAGWALVNRNAAIAARDETVRTANAAASSASKFVYAIFGGYGSSETLAPEKKAAILEDAKGLLDKIREIGVVGPSTRRADGAVQTERAQNLLRNGDARGAEQASREAVAQFEALYAAEPRDYGVRGDLAVAYDRLGTSLLEEELTEAARRAFETGLSRAEFSLQDSPDVSAQLTRAVLLDRLAQLSGDADDWATAIEMLERARAIRDAVAAKDDAPENLRQAAESIRKIAEARLAIGDPANALPLLIEARSRLAKLRHSVAVEADMTSTLSFLSVCYEALGRSQESFDALSSAFDAAEDLETQGSSYVEYLTVGNKRALALLVRKADATSAVANFDHLLNSPTPIDLPKAAEPAVKLERQIANAGKGIAGLLPQIQGWPADKAAQWRGVTAELLAASPSQRRLQDRWQEVVSGILRFSASRAAHEGATKEALSFSQSMVGVVPSGGNISRAEAQRLARAEGQLSWNALLDKQFTLSLQAADAAAQLIASRHLANMPFVDLNRAHALMFNDQVEEAMALYSRQNRAQILADFKDLRMAGLCHQSMCSIDSSIVCSGNQVRNAGSDDK